MVADFDIFYNCASPLKHSNLLLFSRVNILTNVKMHFIIKMKSTYEPYPVIVQKLKASNIFVFPQAKHSMCVLKDGVKLLYFCPRTIKIYAAVKLALLPTLYFYTHPCYIQESFK